MSNKERRDKEVVNEKDIETLKESIKKAYICYDYGLDYESFSMGIAEIVEHILAEREQDKKIIQELEKCKIVQDKNIRSGKPVIEGTRLTVIDVLLSMTKFIREHEKEFRKNHVDISSEQIITAIDYLLENSIPKQKVKDKLEQINRVYNESVNNIYENPTDALIKFQRLVGKIEILEELLEED